MPTPSVSSDRRAASARRSAPGRPLAIPGIARGLLAVAALLAASASAAPPPGTPIENRATATFLASGPPIESNTVTTVVGAPPA